MSNSGIYELMQAEHFTPHVFLRWELLVYQ